jgi:hypothetical protein
MTVVYIIGSGNSGSTLFSFILGSHSEIVTVGEISRIDDYRAFDLKCTCGERLSRCIFWRDVLEQDDYVRMAPIMLTNSMHRLPRCPRKGFRNDPNYLSVVEANLNLYRRIVNVSGKQVIVDSSKDPARLLYLYASGSLHILPLHLVRDGRAYVDSARKRGHRSTVGSVYRWIMMNLAAERVLIQMGSLRKFMRVSYVDFVENPEATMKEICGSLGLEYESRMMEYQNNCFHNIAGTRGRSSFGPIRLQDSWRERLTSLDRLMFAFCGGHYFNRRFGV